MAGKLIRILSDIHYGDRASRVTRLDQLRPLLADVDAAVFNGDTLDTRTGPHPNHTAQCRADVLEFAAAAPAPVTFLTGNHDPDFSREHWRDLAGGAVFVVHGDVLFDDIVPWGRDAAIIRAKIAAAMGRPAADGSQAATLEERVAIWRSVAASIPQRHQSEKNLVKYIARFAVDTVWPPTRCLQVFRAWRREPHLATALVRQERPKAKFVILGHTHRPAIRRIHGGPLIINTGSFTAPFGGYAVDVLPGLLRVRRVEYSGQAFRPGAPVAEFRVDH